MSDFAPIVDVAARYQPPGSVDFSRFGGAIIQTSHGRAEEVGWREQFNECVAAQRPLGLYHFAESTDIAGAIAEAQLFYGLVGFLRPEQVYLGLFVDPETGQRTPWVDAFRSAANLFAVGLYGNLSAFNLLFREYMHFGLNWLAMPDGTTVPFGWTVPDHVLVQYGQVDGIDANRWGPAQPYPFAWSGSPA